MEANYGICRSVVTELLWEQTGCEDMNPILVLKPAEKFSSKRRQPDEGDIYTLLTSLQQKQHLAGTTSTAASV